MNVIILMGRLTKDPEVRYTPNGKILCTFTVACPRKFKNTDGSIDTDFISCVAWGKTAELIGNSSLAKGQRGLFRGWLQVSSYDGKDGVKHYRQDVVVDNMEFIEKRSDTTVSNTTTPTTQSTTTTPPPATQGSFEEFGSASSYEPFDENIPF